MISPAEIARWSHRFGVSDRVIEKDYVLSWLLVAIGKSGLRDALAFKGGTALKRAYFPDYRFSEDLDFTIRSDELSHDEVVRGFVDLFPWLEQQVNLGLTLRSAERSTSGSTTLLINYVGPLRARPGSRYLKVDLTRGELLLYALNEPYLQAPYSDYPKNVRFPTYSLEEILTEKLCALIGRTEPRDLYDVYWLLECGQVDLETLPAGFAAKCRHKGQDPERLRQVLEARETTFARLWKSRLAMQVQDLPHLNEVLRSVHRHLRLLGLA